MIMSIFILLIAISLVITHAMPIVSQIVKLNVVLLQERLSLLILIDLLILIVIDY